MAGGGLGAGNGRVMWVMGVCVIVLCRLFVSSSKVFCIAPSASHVCLQETQTQPGVLSLNCY